MSNPAVAYGLTTKCHISTHLKPKLDSKFCICMLPELYLAPVLLSNITEWLLICSFLEMVERQLNFENNYSMNKNCNIISSLVVIDFHLLHGTDKLRVSSKGGKLSLKIRWFVSDFFCMIRLYPLWLLYQMCKLGMKTVANARFYSTHATDCTLQS